MNIKAFREKNVLVPIAAVLGAFLFALFFSHSIYIAIAFALFISIFISIAQRKSESKRAILIQSACPEMIDILISGIQSGLSLNESLVGLAERGPDILRSEFEEFSQTLYAQGDFREALITLKESFAQPNMDLIIESLLISKELGGAELLNILRLLGNFIREDLALRREITVKHNWIKNSAHLSAAAPWVLLLLLSTQPSTARAFSTRSGVLILCTGLVLTAVAYLWMNKLSQMPQQSRIFIDVKRMEQL